MVQKGTRLDACGDRRGFGLGDGLRNCGGAAALDHRRRLVQEMAPRTMGHDRWPSLVCSLRLAVPAKGHDGLDQTSSSGVASEPHPRKTWCGPPHLPHLLWRGPPAVPSNVTCPSIEGPCQREGGGPQRGLDVESSDHSCSSDESAVPASGVGSSSTSWLLPASKTPTSRRRRCMTLVRVLRRSSRDFLAVDNCLSTRSN